MKKAFFLILVSCFVYMANAADIIKSDNAAAAATEQTYSVLIHLQTNHNAGSTVTYHNGSGYVTEPLRVITNPLNVKPGTVLTISLLIMTEGTVYATDYEPRPCVIPITDGFWYDINTPYKEIYIRVEPFE